MVKLQTVSIIICGGRDFKDYEFLKNKINSFQDWLVQYNETIGTIHQGGARGADALAKRYAYERSIDCITHEAEWDKYGKSAGIKRNLRMLAFANPKYTIGFMGGRGTSHMIEISKGIKIRTFHIK